MAMLSVPIDHYVAEHSYNGDSAMIADVLPRGSPLLNSLATPMKRTSTVQSRL